MFAGTLMTAAVAAAEVTPVIEVEDIVGTCAPANNGAGPLWCYGAPLIVRSGDWTFLSLMETGEGLPPGCNTRPRLLGRRDDGAWEALYRPKEFREREPCPLVVFDNGRLFLSMNPLIEIAAPRLGPCDPYLIEFSTADPSRPGVVRRPEWAGEPSYGTHSYRGIAADGLRGEILLLNISGDDQRWSYCDDSGRWVHQGVITFPIRACYPQLALRDRAAHVLAIGDIVEPVEAWREYKFAQTGVSWDYVFRRLFYTWTADITRQEFSAPIELDQVEQTGGHIWNADLWLDAEGQTHVLYLRRSVQSPLMRDQFFPDVPITLSLVHAVVRDGHVVHREVLLETGDGIPGPTPSYPRFHATDAHTLYVVYHAEGTDPDGREVWENRIVQVLPRGHRAHVRIPLEHPIGGLFTASENGGSPPSEVLDLFGMGRDGEHYRYARVRLR